MELKEIIETKFTELSQWQERASAEIKACGDTATETKAAIEAIQTDLDDLKMAQARASVSSVARLAAMACSLRR